MSNIYIKEPPTSGKVLLETSVGDIDIELWCKECPKACRNFIQLCMEGYFNNTFFHRLIPGFLVQGGDPSGTGDGGESIYGKAFKDEFHQRLKFERRGLLGMASVEPNSNRSQFFFTLDAAPELTNKNTLFGKVSGNTLYNMLALGETGLEEDGRPSKKNYIFKAEILNNPFDDIEPRENVIAASRGNSNQKKENEEEAPKAKVQAVKNFNLLSFGDEAEEDEEEMDEKSAVQFKGSAHDLLANDPKLVKHNEKQNTREDVEIVSRKHKVQPSSDVEDDNANKNKKARNSGKSKSADDSDSSDLDINSEAERNTTEKIAKLKEESENLKAELSLKASKKAQEAKQKKEKEIKDQQNADDIYSTAYMKKYQHLKKKSSKSQSEKNSKQDSTMKMLAQFEAKLNAANRLNLASSYDDDEEEDDPTAVTTQDVHSSSAWLTHTFKPETDDSKQARDANVQRADDEYEIFDPRNPMNKRRRLNEAKSAKDRRRPLAGVKDLD